MGVFAILKNAHKVLFSIGFGAGFLLFVLVSPVGAVGTVQAAICGQDSGASLTVGQPTSDSVISNPSVVISGTVAQATALELMVDGEYSSTIALNSTDTSYSSAVVLVPGTHIISLQANDVCLINNASASVVVTYQPVAQPGEGATAVTNVGGVILGSDVPKEDTTLAVPGASASTSAFLRALDFDTVTSDGVLKGALRLGLMFSGLVINVGPYLFAQLLPQFAGRLRGLAVHSFGIGLMFLALIV